MTDPKEIAHALGYHAKAHCRAKCVQDFAPYEYRNNIDLQLAFVAGWKEAVADDEVNRLSQSSDAKYESLVSAIGILSRAMEELRRTVERQNNPSYSLGGAGVAAGGGAGNVSGNCGGGGGRGASGVRIENYEPVDSVWPLQGGGGGGGDDGRSRGTSLGGGVGSSGVDYGCDAAKIAADFGMKPPKTVVVTLDTGSMNWKIPEDMHDVVIDAARGMGAVDSDLAIHPDGSIKVAPVDVGVVVKDALDKWFENGGEIASEHIKRQAIQKAVEDDKRIMDHYKRMQAERYDLKNMAENIDPGWKNPWDESRLRPSE